MKKVYIYSVLLLSVAIFAGCKETPKRDDSQMRLTEMQTRAEDSVRVHVVETIPATEAPEWVNRSQEFWEEDQQYFYRGISEGFTNLEAAKRAAQAAVHVGIAEQVKNTVRSEFSRALEAGMYDEDTGGYIKDIFFSVVENLTLSGVRINESYLQRLHEAGDGRDKLYYRAYVLGSIRKQDFRQLVRMSFADTTAQVGANKSAKELLAETEARFWQQQNRQ